MVCFLYQTLFFSDLQVSPSLRLKDSAGLTWFDWLFFTAAFGQVLFEQANQVFVQYDEGPCPQARRVLTRRLEAVFFFLKVKRGRSEDISSAGRIKCMKCNMTLYKMK